MSKKLTFIFLLSFVCVLLLSVKPIYAADLEEPAPGDEILEENYSYQDQIYEDTFVYYYQDQFNVWHTLSVHSKVVVSYSWNEGYVGWIDQIYFYSPTATIDGNSVTIGIQSYNFHSGSSYASASYLINNVGSVTIVLGVDEWGEVDFYASF